MRGAVFQVSRFPFTSARRVKHLHLERHLDNLEHLDNLAEASAKAISNIKFDKVVVSCATIRSCPG